jgi:LysM repeat protein
LIAPAAGFLFIAAACGGGDSPFDLDDPTPSPTALGVSQAPVQATPSATGEACSQAEYEVQDGDVLGAIAVEFDVTVDAIVEANDLPDADTLALGQKLTIPCAEATPTATPSAT